MRLYVMRVSGNWKLRMQYLIKANELRVESKKMTEALSELKKFCLVCSDEQ